MRNRYQVAELLASMWKLGMDERADAEERMPTSHGILDRALFALKDDLPGQISDNLTFAETSVGLRCFELPDVLLAAQEALLTSEPNPTYLSTEIALTEDAARQIVVGAGLSTRDARALGARLQTAAREARETVSTVEPVAA